ncbi:hypothetical protein SUDANB25_01958 [Streptomyces sp. SudanB25_2051]
MLAHTFPRGRSGAVPEQVGRRTRGPLSGAAARPRAGRGRGSGERPGGYGRGSGGRTWRAAMVFAVSESGPGCGTKIASR